MLNKLSLFLFFLVNVLLFGEEQALGLRFKDSEAKSSTGYFQSQWENPREELVELWLYTQENSRLVYKGTGKSTFLSGLPDGTYQLQLRLAGQEPLLAQSTLSVAHYSMQQATAFLLVGALLFVIICFFLFYWHLDIEQTGDHDG